MSWSSSYSSVVSSSCSSSRSSGVFFSFSFFWVLLLVVIYDDNRMGGVFDFFIIINMSSWSSRSSASSSTCTSCSLVLLGGSAMSTLPYVWLTCAFGHNRRGETQLVCWCAFLESAWCPVWDPRRQPGAWGGAVGSLARILAGVCARAGQTRIGGTGGSNPDWGRARSNPDRECGRVKSETGRGPHHENKKIKGMLVFTSGFLLGF